MYGGVMHSLEEKMPLYSELTRLLYQKSEKRFHGGKNACFSELIRLLSQNTEKVLMEKKSAIFS